jgi:AAA15 family ATPase/GTPase
LEHIHNIEIKNFKSIRHAVIDGCKRVNVFVGAPNVGKSNILEALSLFAISKITPSISEFIRLKEHTTLFFDGDIGKTIEVILDDIFRLKAFSKKDVIVFLAEHDRNGHGFSAIDKVSNKPYLQREGIVAESIGQYEIFSLPNSKGYGMDFEGQIDSIRLNDSGKRLQILKYEFKNDAILAKSNSNWQLDQPFGANIFNIISSNSSLRNSIQELFQPYNLELLFDARSQAFTILKRTASGIFSIPYELIADTLQRLIFYKTAIQTTKDAVLLFEEPEAHMYPPYIAKFTADMIYDENANQYFITTHSPFVVNDIMENLKKEDYAIYTVG